jgi:rare lipoprotein A
MHSIVVRINDRGPYHDNRIIDLSYAAAQELEIYQLGTEQVEIETITANNESSLYLQLGVFNNPDNARNLQHKVTKNALPKPKIKQVTHQGKKVYKVQIGPLYSNSEVDELNLKLARLGILKTRYVR